MYCRLKSPSPPVGAQAGMLAMRPVPYPVPTAASYYDYPLSMAAVYRSVPFPLTQFNPALLFNQGTPQGEAATSVDSVLPTVSNTSVVAGASTATGQVSGHHNLVGFAPQTGIKNEPLPSSEITPSATEFDPYNPGLVSPTVSKNLEAALTVEKSKDMSLKTEIKGTPEMQQYRRVPPLRLIHLGRGELLNQCRDQSVSLSSYTITEDEYDKMDEDTHSQRKVPTRENVSPPKPVTSAFQSTFQHCAPRPAAVQNPFQTHVPPAQVDSQLNQLHANLNQSIKKSNEGWIGNAALSHSYTSEAPQQEPMSVCQVDNQNLTGSSYEESCVDVREKLLPNLYNNAFYSGYTPSGSIFYSSPSARLPSATTQTIAPTRTTNVLSDPPTAASLSSSSSTSSPPPSSSPFPSTTTTASTSVSSSASIATALVNPMTLLAETEECGDDGFPMADDTDESEFSALDLVMLNDH